MSVVLDSAEVFSEVGQQFGQVVARSEVIRICRQALLIVKHRLLEHFDSLLAHTFVEEAGRHVVEVSLHGQSLHETRNTQFKLVVPVEEFPFEDEGLRAVFGGQLNVQI